MFGVPFWAFSEPISYRSICQGASTMKPSKCKLRNFLLRCIHHDSVQSQTNSLLILILNTFLTYLSRCIHHETIQMQITKLSVKVHPPWFSPHSDKFSSYPYFKHIPNSSVKVHPPWNHPNANPFHLLLILFSYRFPFCPPGKFRTRFCAWLGSGKGGVVLVNCG